MSRPLAVCVDDFGATPGIAAAVERLARVQRVQAVSCLVNTEGWPRDATRLRALGPRVDAGLHLCLTEGRPLSTELARVWPRLPRLATLLAIAHVGAVPRAALRAEVEAQLAAFSAAAGALPAFVDGHQHVHHLPGVREIVLEVLERAEPRPALRNTGCIRGPGFAFKRAVIEHTGGRALQAALLRGGWRMNPALTGVYDFATRDYRALMRAWLLDLPADGTLLFCHPSTPGEGPAFDPIAPARVRELEYLESAAFAADLAGADVTLAPVWRALSETTTRDSPRT